MAALSSGSSGAGLVCRHQQNKGGQHGQHGQYHNFARRSHCRCHGESGDGGGPAFVFGLLGVDDKRGGNMGQQGQRPQGRINVVVVVVAGVAVQA